GETALARVVDGLGYHLLPGRVLVQRLVVADLDEEMALGVDDAQMRGHRLAAEGQRAKGESAALRRVSRDLRIEAHQLGAQGDGGSVLALPSPRLDLEEVRESRVERLRILAVHLRVLDLALRSEEHTSELQSRFDLVCRLLLE